jgi:hypothetical protein
MKANNKLTLAGRTEFEKIVSQEIITLARKIHFICMATEKCGPLFSLFDDGSNPLPYIRAIDPTTIKMKSEKTKKIIYWVLTGLVSFVFLGSASGKLTGNEEAFKMAAEFGIDAKTYTMIGVLELISLILFILPRSGVVGTLLLSAYMGGAIATHLQHELSIVAPCVILTFVLLVSFYRFPELINKIFNRQS